MSKLVLVRNIASLSTVQAANYLLPLLSIPIITRIIGPEKFGVINYAGAFIAYFNIIISYGFDLTATRTVAKNPKNSILINKVFNEILLAKLILFIISTILFLICLLVIPPLRIEWKVSVFSFLFCISTVLTQNWLFVAMQDLSKIAIFEFTSKLLFTLTVLVVVKKKEDYLWQPLVTSLVQITIAIISFLWAIKKYRLNITRTGFLDVISLLKREFTVFFSLILISLYTTTNVVILGLLQSSMNVGYFTGGQKLIVVTYSIINMPLSQALFPFIGRSFSRSFQEGLANVHKLIPFILMITGVSGVIMVTIGPWALRIFYGDAFLPSVIVFQLLSFAPVFIALSSVFGTQIMLNLNMDKLFMKITLLVTCISIVTNLVLAQKFGYIGTAINWLLTEILIAISMYIALRNKGINPIDFRQFGYRQIHSQVKPLFAK